MQTNQVIRGSFDARPRAFAPLILRSGSVPLNTKVTNMNLKSRLSKIATMLLFCVLPMVHAEPVNINSADVTTLAKELKGIGPARAQAIVAYRTQHGLFRTVDDLALVKGIGPSVIEKNRVNLRVNGGPAPARAAVPAVPASIRIPLQKSATSR